MVILALFFVLFVMWVLMRLATTLLRASLALFPIAIILVLIVAGMALGSR